MSQEMMLDEMGAVVNKMIALFKNVNPMFATFFANKTERNAIETIITQQGEESLVKMLNWYEKVKYEEFCPQFTKPTELLKQWGKLINYYKKNESKEDVKKEVIDYSKSQLWVKYMNFRKHFTGEEFFVNNGLELMSNVERFFLLDIKAIKQLGSGDVINRDGEYLTWKEKEMPKYEKVLNNDYVKIINTNKERLTLSDTYTEWCEVKRLVSENNIRNQSPEDRKRIAEKIAKLKLSFKMV